MKFLIQILVILIISSLLQFFLPWWSMAVGTFAVGYAFANSGLKSFFAGFIGIALLWFALAFYIDSATQSLLTEKVARLFPTRTVPLLFVLTSVIGGLVGGLASLTGSILSYKPRKW